ncbi:hypothetical protein [Mycobacterium sp. SM3041]|uniref:hypothetical protein n=1 Tax=Mycobacterium sp. SM3041 TaxID=3114291 RepID=UPI003204B5BD
MTQLGPAYEATGAALVSCPNCGAAVGDCCMTNDGVRRVRGRRVPCVQRLLAAERAGQRQVGDEWSPTSVLASTPDACGRVDAFTEPLHPREEPQ